MDAIVVSENGPSFEVRGVVKHLMSILNKNPKLLADVKYIGIEVNPDRDDRHKTLEELFSLPNLVRTDIPENDEPDPIHLIQNHNFYGFGVEEIILRTIAELTTKYVKVCEDRTLASCAVQNNLGEIIQLLIKAYDLHNEIGDTLKDIAK